MQLSAFKEKFGVIFVRKKLFFVVVGIVFLILLIGGGYYLWSQDLQYQFYKYKCNLLQDDTCIERKGVYVFVRDMKNDKFISGEVIGINGNLVTLSGEGEEATFSLEMGTQFYIVNQRSSGEIEDNGYLTYNDENKLEDILKIGDLILRAQFEGDKLRNEVNNDNLVTRTAIKVFRKE